MTQINGNTHTSDQDDAIMGTIDIDDYMDVDPAEPAQPAPAAGGGSGPPIDMYCRGAAVLTGLGVPGIAPPVPPEVLEAYQAEYAEWMRGLCMVLGIEEVPISGVAAAAPRWLQLVALAGCTVAAAYMARMAVVAHGQS